MNKEYHLFLEFLILAVLAFFLFKPHFVKKKLTSYQILLVVLMIAIHFVATIFYYLYVLQYHGDVLNYYKNTYQLSDYNSKNFFGVGFILLLMQPLKWLNFSFISVFFVGSLIGLKGFMIYFELIKNKIRRFEKYNIIQALPIFLLLSPGLHFWTGAFSKDAFVFTAMALLLKILFNKRKFNWQVWLLFFVTLCIRPYIAGLLSIAALITVLIDKNIKPAFKWTTFALFTSVGTIIAFSIKQHMGLSRFSFDELLLWLHNVNEVYLPYNESINLNETNMLERFFSMAFKPTFFEVYKWTHLAVAVENIILLSCFVIFFVSMIFKIRTLRITDTTFRFTFLMGISVWLLFSIFIYNYGLAHRYKTMYLPFTLFAMYRLLPRQITLKDISEVLHIRLPFIGKKKTIND